ncbi:PepSY domain-containing protein [Curtobacterium sp. Leaf261]|uniref:PepSY domain-containing protein n=1 Tax=Curtobacterium sp. Leaf261 TaxID=1736311 RepID=UPI0006F8A6FA|nr:PepSY domain-containing protein [Curtobacterium sp. Leaf261]KQO62859.1 hypothetical protein ASF23_08010 [Curtobacterium sp. Leaf261]
MNTTKRSTTIRRTTLLVGLPLVGALALAGCSNDDDDDDRALPASSSSSSASSSTGASSSAGGSTAAGNDALEAAAKSALDAVGSGSVISIEQEAGATSWEVLVAGSDGAEQEVHTDAAGTSVTSGPTTKSSDQDDLAENTRFLGAAKLGHTEAAKVMTDAVAGTVTELGLDDHAGAVVWEGNVVDTANTKHSVRIDAGSGDVVTNEVDTDD